MEVDSWRSESGGFEGGEVWISPHQTDSISPTPNTFGLENSKNQQYLSPELEYRRESSDPQNLEEPGTDLRKVTGILVGDTNDTPGRLSGELLDRFGQNNIKSRFASVLTRIFGLE